MVESALAMETDWLNTTPVFYNVITKKFSKRISDVIDWANLQFDNEGLYNYLRFGYIIFGKTPIKNVERLPPNSVIKCIDNDFGQRVISIETKDDPIFNHFERRSCPEECLDILKKKISSLLASQKAFGKNILLPLSGGYDSRIILSMIDDKSSVKAITYDVSLSEHFSSETVNAQILCQKLGVDWRRIDLKRYWGEEIVGMSFSLFGPEMSYQPAYHVEMYENVKKSLGENYVVLSGSVGDWWSGEKLALKNLSSWEDYPELFHTIGISIPTEYIQVKADESYNESCVRPVFEEITSSYIYRTVFSKRGRIGLASFIDRVAESAFGSLTPFYDLDVAMSQLALPSDERKERKWQKEYFSKVGLDVDQSNRASYSISNNNSLDLIAACFCSSEMVGLDPSLFDGIIDRRRIEWINKCLGSMKSLEIQRYIDVAKWTFSNDNSKKLEPGNRMGAYFDHVCSHLLNSWEYNQAINEWSILAPIQKTISIAQSGDYKNIN